MSATEASFTSWLGRQGDETDTNSRVVVRNAGLCAGISDNERDSCVFTLKVYLLQWGVGQDVEEAVQTSKWCFFSRNVPNGGYFQSSISILTSVGSVFDSVINCLISKFMCVHLVPACFGLYNTHTHTALSELGLSSVTTLILTFPSGEFTLDSVKSLWKGAESLVASGVATDLGTADLDKTQFEELYEWASVKPKVNQVNLAHCCTMPEASGRIY